MPANTDKFIKGARRWSGQIGASGISDGIVLTAPLVSATGLPSDTAVEITIDRVDANGQPSPAKEEVIRGVVSGTNIINCVRGVEGVAQAHGAGAVVEIRLTADQWNRMIDAIIAEHNQDGSHKFHGLVEKTTPVDADEIGLIDSAASWVLKKLTWANLKATLKAYFDTLYSPITGAWTTYTPATSGLTLGNGTIVARYMQIGKTVHVQARFILGSTSVIGGDPMIGLPITEKGTIESLGIARFQDASSYIQYGGWWRTGFIGYNTTYGDITATVPFTWAVGDIIWLSCTYEAA